MFRQFTDLLLTSKALKMDGCSCTTLEIPKLTWSMNPFTEITLCYTGNLPSLNEQIENTPQVHPRLLSTPHSIPTTSPPSLPYPPVLLSFTPFQLPRGAELPTLVHNKQYK